MALRQYNYDITQEFKSIGKPRGEVYYGVELETETAFMEDSLAAQKVYTEILSGFGEGFAAVKRDGSLTKGIEIVTVPASLTVHRRRWAKFFAHLPQALTVSHRCGMHVHHTKAPLTTEQRGRIHQFINRPQSRRFVEAIAGRAIGPTERYRNACQKPEGQEEYTFPCGKYEAYNLRGMVTGEMRIFAATLSYARLMANLEFVAAMVHFSQTQPLGEKLNRETLVAFVEGYEKMYPEFVKWERGLEL